ncbi:hypothetical protein AK812_SmicGene1915 [Symbiodinium microadriaticum]|uniref:AVL9/DENND6 domain-containing protein n=1 Tax=Symbiodinium microadriaticum TaxID=2951 RepID=A0A1Q9F2R6_SYMMI|nr:hypothetical protein AK812_SmicGene1915 [Symbiodinium microadriaticum]
MVIYTLSSLPFVFFEQRDFRCTDLLRDFDTQLDAVSFEKLPDTELFFGVHHAQLFRGLRHKLLSVLKAILLEAKVISESAEQCSRTVLALLSLLPGGNMGFPSSASAQDAVLGGPVSLQGPIVGIFPQKVFPYLGLHMLDSLLQMRGFLIGTTNRIFVDRTAPDLILEVPSTTASTEYSVEFPCKEVKELTRCTGAEKAGEHV